MPTDTIPGTKNRHDIDNGMKFMTDYCRRQSYYKYTITIG